MQRDDNQGQGRAQRPANPTPIQTREEFFDLESKNQSKILAEQRKLFDELRKNAVPESLRAGRPALDSDWTAGNPAAVQAGEDIAANQLRRNLAAQETAHTGELERLLNQQKQQRRNLEGFTEYDVFQNHFDLKERQEQELKELLTRQSNEISQFFVDQRRDLEAAFGGQAAFNDAAFIESQNSAKAIAEAKQEQIKRHNQDTANRAQTFLGLLDSRTNQQKLAQKFQDDQTGWQISRPGATPEVPDVVRFKHTSSNMEGTVYNNGSLQVGTNRHNYYFTFDWLSFVGGVTGFWGGFNGSSVVADIQKDMERALSRVPNPNSTIWEINGHKFVQRAMREALIKNGVDPKNIRHVGDHHHQAYAPTLARLVKEEEMRRNFLLSKQAEVRQARDEGRTVKPFDDTAPKQGVTVTAKNAP